MSYNIHPLYDLGIPLLGIYPRVKKKKNEVCPLYIHIRTCMNLKIIM